MKHWECDWLQRAKAGIMVTMTASVFDKCRHTAACVRATYALKKKIVTGKQVANKSTATKLCTYCFGMSQAYNRKTQS